MLELGAATGRFTAELAAEGHQVTAVELVPALIEKGRARVEEQGLAAKVRWVCADARQLSSHVEGRFDAALVMGPLYHLERAPERLGVLSQTAALLAPGGIAVTTHLSRIGLIGYMLTRFPTWAMDTPGQVEDILQRGYLPDHPRDGNFRGYWTTPDELRALHAEVGLEVIALHCPDPCIGSVDELFNRLPAPYQARWTEVLTRVSGEPQAWGTGRGLLCVSRRPG